MDSPIVPVPPRPSPSFDRMMTLLGAWFASGIYIDGWAHNHLKSALETFFTPWHALMYTGFAACALTLFVKALAGRRAQGTLRPSWSWLNPWSWRYTMPPGYFPALIGAAIFAGGGAFDVIWHLTFGIEKDIEALLSPAHLILAVGAFLILSGPFRAAWRSAEPPRGLVAALPLILSMAFMISIVSFMTQFGTPERHMASGFRPTSGTLADISQGRAVAGFIIQLSLLTGLSMLAMRRWGRTLPFGAITLFFGINMAGMAMMVTDGYEFRLLPAALIAGLFADWLRLRGNQADVAMLDGSRANPFAIRTFATLVPAAYALVIFIILQLTGNVWWSIHMWAGTVAMAGIAGLLLSYVFVPPPIPSTQN